MLLRNFAFSEFEAGLVRYESNMLIYRIERFRGTNEKSQSLLVDEAVD